jgi:Holliday junction resolvase RusA-like endonuclease
MIHFTISGNPVSSKNSRPIFINKATGSRFIGKSKTLKDYIESGLYELKKQRLDKSYAYIFPREMELQVTFLFYVKDKRARDLCNLIQAPQDLLKVAGIVTDDCQIKSLDGSRIYYDKLNPRTEIDINIF